MAGRVKAKEGERLDDEHIEKARKFLEEGGKKKDVYDILNIKANPTRLAKIFEEYDERKAMAERHRKANRGKPASNFDIQTIIAGALEGEAISSIADTLYRSSDFVKRVIQNVGIPQKIPGSWFERRFKSSIPDQCVSSVFEKYQIVWSDKYQGLAIVLEPGLVTTRIYVIEKIEYEPEFSLNIGGTNRLYTGYGGHHAWQRNEELGSLEHLKKYGVDLAKPYRASFPNWLGVVNA